MGVTKIEAYHGQSLANSTRSLVTAFTTTRSTNRMFLAELQAWFGSRQYFRKAPPARANGYS